MLDRMRRYAPRVRTAPAPENDAKAAFARCRGDHDLNPGMLPDRTLVPAAVLVPLVDRADGMTVLLTKRTDHLHNHAGQISFPGGCLDPEDRDAQAAALREV